MGKKLLVLWMILLLLVSSILPDVYASAKSVLEEQYEAGMGYFAEGDYVRAFSYFQISGKVKGYAPAQNMLGVCYRDGLGTEKDLAEAENYFRLSADQGYAPAEENLRELEKNRNSEEEWVCLYSAYYYSGKLSSARRMTYNADGEIWETSSLNYDTDGMRQLTIKTNYFDENGVAFRAETVDAVTGNLISCDSMEHNEEGKLLHSQTIDVFGSVRSEQNNSYSEDGSILEHIEYDDNEEIKSRSVTIRNADNQTLKTETYDEYGEISYSSETYYDSQGRKTRDYCVSYSKYGENIESSVSYVYNEEGVLTRSTEKYLTGGDYLTGSVYIKEYFFDEYGNLLEECTSREGEETNRHTQKWGLLRNGEIIRTSFRDEFVDELDALETQAQDSKTIKNALTIKSSGKISLERTVLLDLNNVKVTAESYSADGNREGVRMLFENNRDEDIKVKVAYLQVNGKRIEPTSYFDIKAHGMHKDKLYISTDMLDAAGIDRIESITIGLDVLKEYEKQFGGDPVTISIHDERNRASAFIPIEKAILSEEKLKINFVGYDLKDTYAELYYSIENLSDEAFHIESSDAFLNREKGFSLAISQNVEANSSVLYMDRFDSPTYTRIESLTELSFGLELRQGYLNQFGKAEKIVMEFAPDGKLNNFSGDIIIDKTSEFWKKAFASTVAGFCPECGNQIDPDSKFCMYCGHRLG